jgi:hypothetical protein
MTSSVTDTPTVTVTEPTPLTLADTCDACGYSEDTDRAGTVRQSAIARAYVRYVMPDGKDLILCGHHAREYELALVSSGATVTSDQRDELTVKPGVSAAG